MASVMWPLETRLRLPHKAAAKIGELWEVRNLAHVYTGT